MPSYGALPHAVVGTHRIATIPERLAHRFAQHLPIRILRPQFRMPQLNEIMQWHEAHTADAGLAWLRGMIVDAARSLDTAADQRRGAAKTRSESQQEPA